MITLFLLCTSFIIAGSILSIFGRIFIFLLALFFEVFGFIFLFVLIGGIGVLMFIAVDAVILKALIKAQ